MGNVRRAAASPEWRLPTEPWVFRVDGHGRIRAKLEGFVDVGELEASVRKYLL